MKGLVFTLFLLLAGIFMGWALGTNDAANAFGTAVATGVIKHRTAILIISVMVIIGAILQGDGNIDKLTSLAQSNGVIASVEDVKNAITYGSLSGLQKQSATKAAIIFACAGISVFIMSFLKLPVSANQSVTGAVIGWGLFHSDYTDSTVLFVNLPRIAEFFITWIINPLGAGIIAFTLVYLSRNFFKTRTSSKLIKTGYLLSGALASYSIGVNSSASVTAFYYDPTHIGANLFCEARLCALIGGISITLGVITFSKRVMMTVGKSIAHLTQTEGFLVVIAMALTVLLMENTMGIPVSTSQSVVGAVIGAGLVSGRDNVDFVVIKNIVAAWISSPAVSGVLAYFTAVLTQKYF